MSLRISQLPDHCLIIDTIQIHNTQDDLIEILQDKNDYYALYSRCLAFGPCPSMIDILKKVIVEIALNGDVFCDSITKIDNILRELKGKEPRE